MKTALIIGAGIGGPSAAMALQRAGWEPTLVEGRPEGAEDVGAFLNTASNALDALNLLGVANRVKERGFATPRMVMWSGTGKRLGEMPNGLTLDDGTQSLTVRRGHLHAALLQEARSRGIPIRFGKRLVDATESASEITARFDDGSTSAATILIGADGLHSRVRALIDPSSPAPRFTGQLSISGICSGAGLDGATGAYNMIFGKRAFFSWALSPAGEAWWFANVAWSGDPREGAARDWKPGLRELFRGDRGPADRLIDRTDLLTTYPIYDLPRVPRWHHGRKVLLGDAAHATSPSAGQGAAMAIEDAVTLGRCLRDAAEPMAAFTAYEALRRERVEKVVRYSARVGSTKVAGPLGRVLRDALMPMALRFFAVSQSNDWLYRHHIAW